METREKISTIPEVPGLEFDEAGHIYRLDDIIIPSVSAVMAPLSKVRVYLRSRLICAKWRK